LQTLAELRVVHQRTAIAHEGDDGLEEIGCLGREQWKGLFSRGLGEDRLASPGDRLR
jgi:hypothetical protein